MEFALMGVTGFASGWMLLWAAAATIPLVLHFLYRRRQAVIRWAAMQLLLQVIEKEAKRVRLEQLLLLVVRTLILLTLAVALARPFWDNGSSGASTEGAIPATTWILAVDVSYSMGYRADNETRLQSAQRRAVEIVESAREGDAIALVALGKPARAVIATPSFDRQSVLAELGQLTLNDAGCDLSGGLQLMAALVQRAQQEEVLPSAVRVVILSDLGSDHWQSAVAGSDTKRLRDLGSNCQLTIEALGDEIVSNVAVAAIRPASGKAILEQALEVEIEVKNYGDAAVEELPIQLAVDDKTVASDVLNLAAQATQSLRLSFTPSRVGRSVLTARIAADRLAVDNSRSVVIDVRKDYEVLFVEQQAGESRILGLSLRPDKADRASLQRATISALELSTVELTNWQVVVVNDVASLDTLSHTRLERYARQGGAVVFLFGPRTSASVWNGQESLLPFLGFQLREPSAAGNWNIDPLEYRSPIVSLFAGFPDAGLLTTPIFRYWKIQDSGVESAKWLVDLATTEGDPLIVRHRVGDGAVTSVLSAPQSGANRDDAWNAMATWPSFVPLMQNLIQTAMESGSETHTILAGQPLVGRTMGVGQAGERGAQLITITKPDRTTSQIAAADLRPDGAWPWVFAQTQQSGTYIVSDATATKSPMTDQPYVANVDLSESSLRCVKPADLPKFPAPQTIVVDSTQSAPRSSESSPVVVAILLTLLGGLLVIESLLAWAMGRRAG